MTEQSAIKVLCVDDNPLVAQAIETKLRLSGGFEWLGHVVQAAKLRDAVKRMEPGGGVILMDLDMPGEDPFQVMHEISATTPNARVLVLSGHVRSDLLDRAIESGAWGYVSKSDGAEELIDAIHAVAEGRFVLGSHVLQDQCAE